MRHRGLVVKVKREHKRSKNTALNVRNSVHSCVRAKVCENSCVNVNVCVSC